MSPINHRVPASESGRSSWHLPASPLQPGIPLLACSFLTAGRTHGSFLCALCSAELAPHSLAHLVLPSVHRRARQLRCSCRANRFGLCLGGLQLLCCSVPVTFHCLTPIISCSSSPLNLCYALAYESHLDPDRVGKIHLSFRGYP